MRSVDLDDKYTATDGRVFMSGTQALVRLPLVQIRRDRAAGLKTAGFISGYRGSPLGGYDQQLAAARDHLAAHDIVFRPGVNEELAATAVWGSQQLALSPGRRYDGVVGIWYGKGPGVDRSGDVFKHANAAGSSAHGGVLCIAGDDHGAKSSTVPHQSDHAFGAALMPMLYPSSIHEFVELGLLGFAMSRYSGCWVGMKVISDTVETTAAVEVGHEVHPFQIPTDFPLPPGGLNLRWPDDRHGQDARLQNVKPYAAMAFARANLVDRVTLDSPRARLGIVASGKAYEDVRQALRELDIDDAAAVELGLRVYKVRMPWPLEPEGIRRFALGLEEIIIVEERREMIENQIKQQLFNWRADVRPRIIGKFDHEDHPVLSLSDELTVGAVVRVIADRLLRLDMPAQWHARIGARLAWFKDRARIRREHHAPVDRQPFFCSGCPHNTSTRVPEGSRALAGIGCHFMAQWMDRNTQTFSQMGGEGVAWTGTAPFTDEKHVFANLGDGTYFHSGLLAVRQAVAAGANITYKILYNDAVAMTGGQSVDGTLSPERITHQLLQEGVSPVYLLSDRPELYDAADLAPGTIVRHRDSIEEVMLALRETPGCSAIVYEQTCAAEKRRRRKRGTLPEPPQRVFINPAVCEGCGDCSVQSNCISVEPLETAFGRKRRINQSTCNKDYSCLKGFCPSFVTVEGGTVRKPSPTATPDFSRLPEPARTAHCAPPYNIAITGIGGTGVLTIGAILGMAAHLEGKAPMILDMAGLAQKGGAVLSQVRIGPAPEDVTAPRIVTGSADLLLAADDVVAASAEAISLCAPDRTNGILNTHAAPVAAFVRARDFDFRTREVEGTVAAAVRPDADRIDFSRLAEALLGDSIATNVMMLGFACQRGLLPVGRAAIEEAIRINGVGVAQNMAAFGWGRLLAVDPKRVEAIAGAPPDEHQALDAMTLAEVIAHRAAHLTAYQNAALARRYRALVDRVAAAASSLPAGQADALTRAVAIGYAKLLAYKDEYEVARLHAAPEFAAQLATQFAGDLRLTFHLAPPVLSRPGPGGRPVKRRFGGWMMSLFHLLAAGRRLRGTAFDPFGYTAERRMERRLIADYEEAVARVLAVLAPETADTALKLLALPQEIRGFGPVKAASVAEADAERTRLLMLLGSRQPKISEVAEKIITF